MTSEANRLKELILPNIRAHNCISIMFKAIPATYPNKAHVRLYQQKGLPRAPSNLTPYPHPPHSLHFMRPLSEMFPSKNYMHGLLPLGSYTHPPYSLSFRRVLEQEALALNSPI